jgi:dTMP kinase
MAESCFIMVDGIDGSGKSSIVKAWKEYLTNEGNAIFDLKDYWLEQGKYPDFSELKSYDFIFSGEPTYVGIGKVLREELMNKNMSYPEKAIAHAFSLDRIVLYSKILVPALQDKKCIIQDRGVSTSLCYQSLSGKISVKDLGEMVGNSMALRHAPNHLIIMKVDPEIAIQRLAKRTDKQDNAIFEQLDFQKKAAQLFYSDEFARMFRAHGTEVHYLPADAELDIIKAESIKLLKTILA